MHLISAPKGLLAGRLGILAFILSGCSMATPAAAPSRPVALTGIHMISAQAGWGLSDHAVLRTVDGGRHWAALRVPDLPSSLSDVAFTASGQSTAWLVLPRAVAQGDPLSEVLSTQDGGQHWSRSNVIRGWAFGSSAFSWITRKLGWLLTGEGGAAGSVPINIYRTEDGGLHWRLVAYNHLVKSSLAAPGACDGFAGMSFRSRDMGWAAGACGAAPTVLLLYRTLDGGSRWRRQKLSPPPWSPRGSPIAWNLGPPTFFGPNGILPALVDPPRGLVLYVTQDGGTTWSSTRPLPDRYFAGPQVFVLELRHIWAVVGNTIHFTSDAGRNWQTFTRHLAVSGPTPLDFVNARLPATAGCSLLSPAHLALQPLAKRVIGCSLTVPSIALQLPDQRCL